MLTVSPRRWSQSSRRRIPNFMLPIQRARAGRTSAEGAPRSQPLIQRWIVTPPPPLVARALTVADDHRSAGHHDSAELLYGEVLDADPGNAEAVEGLSAVARRPRRRRARCAGSRARSARATGSRRRSSARACGSTGCSRTARTSAARRSTCSPCCSSGSGRIVLGERRPVRLEALAAVLHRLLPRRGGRRGRADRARRPYRDQQQLDAQERGRGDPRRRATACSAPTSRSSTATSTTSTRDAATAGRRGWRPSRSARTSSWG